MLKLIGILLIAVGCSGIGFYESMELTRHEEILEQVQQMLILLKGEIRYGNSSLCDVFQKVSGKMKGNFEAFLKEMAQQMLSRNKVRFFEIYRNSVQKSGVCKRMTDKEKEAFLEFGNFLGEFDRETQLRQIELYEQELRMQLEELRRQLPEQKKLYRNLGVLGGIFISILLW